MGPTASVFFKNLGFPLKFLFRSLLDVLGELTTHHTVDAIQLGQCRFVDLNPDQHSLLEPMEISYPVRIS